jgi:hypothetical protein
MTYKFEFASRAARLRALLSAGIILVLGACAHDDLTDPVANADPETPPATTSEPAFLAAFQGGIPFGLYRQPNSAFGYLYSGAKQTMGPSYILSSLRETKAKGGKVVIMLAGHEMYYKDANGHFSFTKWKARIDRFRRTNISSYINDGTIVGHFMIDEPQDKANWNGVPVPGSTLEAMAKYSKSIWPNMVTIVRAPPGKIRWSGTYRYLDAAWAQVENPRGTLNVNDFLNQNVSNARQLGLALVVGLNVMKGNLRHTPMTATQIRNWGSIMLSSSYPCAFLSWYYNDTYLSRSSIRDAMRYLRSKAQNRGTKTCRG